MTSASVNSAAGKSLDAEGPRAAKRALRRECQQRRDAMGEEARSEAGRAVCNLLEDWLEFKASRLILTFMPMRAEVDLVPLMKRHPEKRWGVPRIVERPSPHLLFHLYDPQRLVQHRFGMKEPDPGVPLVRPEDVEIALVPGLAFTRSGLRLGYGGGFYDRYLSRYPPPVVVGVCYEGQILEEIPRAEGDVPVQYLVTERGLRLCSRTDPGPALP